MALSHYQSVHYVWDGVLYIYSKEWFVRRKATSFPCTALLTNRRVYPSQMFWQWVMNGRLQWVERWKDLGSTQRFEKSGVWQQFVFCKALRALHWDIQPFSQTVELTPYVLAIDPTHCCEIMSCSPLIKDLGCTPRVVKRAVLYVAWGVT